jgi:gliding motility-associated-like protein
MKKWHLLILLFVFGAQMIKAQTADITTGCSPLKVQFTAPDLTAYYWDFVEGNTSSTLTNPEHIFTTPGTYQVKLFEGEGGEEIGTIEIKVYNDPEISFDTDKTSGCSPLTVNFISHVVLDPDLVVEGYKWAFGDGSVSYDQNPTHNYIIEGTYSVSLEITTNLIECKKVFTLQNLIVTYDLDVKFLANRYSFCEAPATVKFTNKTEEKPGNIYFWDFGNGQSSTVFDPDSITYFSNGVYTISLTVTSVEGCVITKERTLVIRVPKIEMDPPETACLQVPILFNNETLVNTYEWSFDSGASLVQSDEKEPGVFFFTPGIKSIYFKAIDNADCFTDTTFTILIEDPDAAFILSPEISCADPVLINLVAANSSFAEYNWSTRPPGILIPPSASTSFFYDDPDRDSLFLHKRDSIYIKLQVVTDNGCVDEVEKIFVQSKPNAHFIADNAQGCAPLKVTFSDQSFSREDILSWKYLYGNGETSSFNSNADHEFIFDNPGEYYVQMVIENEAGCIDTSAGMWIHVGEPILPIYEVDKTEICLGESITVNFTNNDPRVDAFHLDTDDGRFSQCWADTEATHEFNTLPGEYTVTAVAEYNGCYSTEIAAYTIRVNGAKADIGYLMDCANPYEIFLESESTNATNLEWKVDNTTTADSLNLIHTFSDKGDYTISLEARDEVSGCPSTIDFQTIYVRDVEAKFSIPSKVCDNELYVVDASESIDVDSDCNKGYLWYVPTRRPWESPFDTISTAFPPGQNFVSLVVEDINGCKDTLTKEIQSYTIEPLFSVDKEEFCLPANLEISNLTLSDTTIVKWEWSNGASVKEPIINVGVNYDLNFYLIELRVEDALGCLDTVATKLEIYKPESKINLDPGQNLCVGQDLVFSAEDYTDKGSFLNFSWEFDKLGQYAQQENTVTIGERGIYPLELFFEEESSGCRDSIATTIYVVNEPIAGFISDVDGIMPLCYPQIVSFTNNTLFDSIGFVKWEASDITFSNPYSESQTIELPKGTYDLSLVAISSFGCTDTITRSFTLVGPEGEIITDKSIVCLGEEIEFTLINAVDVNDFEWDFGDGTTIKNVNPIKHLFDRDVEMLNAKIILKSADNGCEQVVEVPLSIFEVIADFEQITDQQFCPGEVFLENLSEGADIYIWDTPSGQLDEESDTLTVVYPGEGSYEIMLTAINSTNDCQDTRTLTVDVHEFENILVMPNMFTPNNDGENDFFHPVIVEDQFELQINYQQFKIYNRWGNLVFDNSDPEGWNGRYNNTEAPTGVYGYYLEFDVNGCQSYIMQGNITLVR